jgi:hypothetical protein
MQSIMNKSIYEYFYFMHLSIVPPDITVSVQSLKENYNHIRCNRKDDQMSVEKEDEIIKFNIDYIYGHILTYSPYNDDKYKEFGILKYDSSQIMRHLQKRPTDATIYYNSFYQMKHDRILNQIFFNLNKRFPDSKIDIKYWLICTFNKNSDLRDIKKIKLNENGKISNILNIARTQFGMKFYTATILVNWS